MTATEKEAPGIVLRGDAPATRVEVEPAIVRFAQERYPSSDFRIAGLLERKGITGKSSDLISSTFLPGYHSAPHTHDCEQMTVCLSGEMWIFVEREGYHLRKGDFHRVPQNAIHWAWNRSKAPCHLITSHAPRLIPEPGEAPFLHPAFSPREEGFAGSKGVRSVSSNFPDHVDVEQRLSDFEDLAWSPFAPTLLMRAEEFPRYLTPMQTELTGKMMSQLDNIAAAYPEAKFARGGLMEWRRTRGNEGDISVHLRKGGYHSPPHIDATDEQLNYCLDGEAWFFVDDEGYQLREGDFLRVPENAVHWAWNRSDLDSTWVETHVPCHSTLNGLYKMDEEPNPTPKPREATLVDPAYALEVEQRLTGSYGS